MSAESDYKCNVCGYEWGALPPSKCPKCNPLNAPSRFRAETTDAEIEAAILKSCKRSKDQLEELKAEISADTPKTDLTKVLRDMDQALIQSYDYLKESILNLTELRIPNSVFEVIDFTDDEVYNTLGVFLSLEEAIAAVDECKKPNDFGSPTDCDEFFKVQIMERKVGWSGLGKKVFERTFTGEFIDPDGYEWKVSTLKIA